MGRYASGARAQAICDRCGLTVKYVSLREEVVRGRRTGLRVCRSCFDPDHPQNYVGVKPVTDAQALRDPRPDNPAPSRKILWGWRPVMGVALTSAVGTVEVQT